MNMYRNISKNWFLFIIWFYSKYFIWNESEALELIARTEFSLVIPIPALSDSIFLVCFSSQQQPEPAGGSLFYVVSRSSFPLLVLVLFGGDCGAQTTICYQLLSTYWKIAWDSCTQDVKGLQLSSQLSSQLSMSLHWLYAFMTARCFWSISDIYK